MQIRTSYRTATGLIAVATIVLAAASARKLESAARAEDPATELAMKPQLVEFPASFADDAALTAYMKQLRTLTKAQGRSRRACATLQCTGIDVNLRVVRNAHYVSATAVGETRTAVAVVEPRSQSAGAGHTRQYNMRTGLVSYVFVVKRAAKPDGPDTLTYSAIEIPYKLANGVRRYTLDGMKEVDSGWFRQCTTPHKHKPGDYAAFRPCPRGAAPAMMTAPKRPGAFHLPSLSIVWAMQAGDTTKGPTDPLWVSCAYGCCTASGT